MTKPKKPDNRPPERKAPLKRVKPPIAAPEADRG